MVPQMHDMYTEVDARFTKDRTKMRSREVAYESIKHAILSGILVPWERLVEERLGDALQLSRTPVREALSILEHEGLIESIPYKGLMVKPVTVDEFLSMYEALGVIEPAIARSAAANASPADIRKMELSLSEAEMAIPDDIPGHLAACREFQGQMGSCAQSPFLTRMLLSIEERSDMYLIHSGKALPPEKMQASIDDRRAILDAIRSSDPAAAAAAAEAHAGAIRLRWREMYPDTHEPHPRGQLD
jgi:DNA-binding GntR family transcriptional regulator